MNGKNRIQTRNSNLELLRIIAMYFIVASHYVNNSGLLDAILKKPTSVNSVILLIFGMLGKTCINCFVLITGYFVCKSNITMRKFVKLLAEIMFYRIVIYLIFLFAGYETISVKKLIDTIIPVSSIQQNFTGCFLVFWLTIPFLNALIKNIDKRMHFLLLVVCGFTYVLMGTVHRVSMNYVSWFIVLYFIASYIRIYNIEIFNRGKLWGIICIISILLSVVSIFACLKFGLGPYTFVSDSNTFLAVLTGISAFLFFNNLKIQSNRIINTVASSTFGVLLLHAGSEAMRQWLWRDLLDNVGAYYKSNIVIHAFLSTLSVFVICVIIDQIRQRLLERPFMKWIDNLILEREK